VEEAYEVADAALADDPAKLEDELGDLLFQTYFLALLLEEQGDSDLATVARRIQGKLVARHPHVFESSRELRSPGEVRERWEDLKLQEGGREEIFHHVPENLPALLFARKLQRRAAAIEFEYPDTPGAVGDLEDELHELKEALEAAGEPPPEAEPDPRLFEELGDVLFAVVNVARRLNVDPELALRFASRRFADRVVRAEKLAAAEGRSFVELSLDEKDRYFDAAKAELHE
jgi:MazG family protein